MQTPQHLSGSPALSSSYTQPTSKYPDDKKKQYCECDSDNVHDIFMSDELNNAQKQDADKASVLEDDSRFDEVAGFFTIAPEPSEAKQKTWPKIWRNPKFIGKVTT